MNANVAGPTGAFTTQVDALSEQEWNGVVNTFADSNVYQTWAYGAVHWGEKQLSHLLLRDNGRLVAAAQVRVVRVPLLGSGIGYVRWGPMCVPLGSDWDPNVWRAMAQALVQEYVVRRRLILRVVPRIFLQDSAAVLATNIWSDLGLRKDPTIRTYQTLRVDLRARLDGLRAQLSSRWRRQLNIGERNHLQILEGHTDDLYQQFLRLYNEMMARKRFETSVDAEKFGWVQQRLPVPQKMMTLICMLNGTAVAGLVVGTVGDTAIYLLAATGDEGLNARGSYVLQWRAIERLKEFGVHYYDLGGVNQEVNPGVYTFKSGMGGQEVTQLGRYLIGDSSLSKLSVAFGESIKRMSRRTRP